MQKWPSATASSKRQTRISRFRRLQPTSTCTSTTPMPRLTGPSRQAPPRFTGQPTTILQAIAGAPSETHLAIVGTSLHPDADAMYAQALRAGAISVEPPTDKPYGDRSAGVRDPFGNSWYLNTFLGR